jgi:hypothetical protein
MSCSQKKSHSQVWQHPGRLLLAAGLLVTSSAIADESGETWSAIRDVAELKALFSDVTLTGQLAGGAEATATYNRNGTAELRAWGGLFPRTWYVTDDALVCIEYAAAKECSRIDREAGGSRFRERNLTTGEVATFTVSSKAPPEQADTDSGGSKAATPTSDELAKELANPNTVLAKLTLKTQFRTFEGDLPNSDDQDAVTMLFQPSFPIPLEKKGDSILFRPAIPILIDQPFFEADRGDFNSDFGLGDISFDLAYSRTTSDGWLYAGGLIATMPTATKDELGKDLWSAGPEVLFGKITNTYVLGAFPNHQWDFAGDGDGEVSLSSGQLFAIYLPGGGWSVGSTPILSYDWKIDEWTIPINLSVGKTVVVNGRPWKFNVEINYYAEQPDAFGPEWMVGFDVTPVVENKILQWFR